MYSEQALFYGQVPKGMELPQWCDLKNEGELKLTSIYAIVAIDKSKYG